MQSTHISGNQDRSGRLVDTRSHHAVSGGIDSGRVGIGPSHPTPDAGSAQSIFVVEGRVGYVDDYVAVSELVGLVFPLRDLATDPKIAHGTGLVRPQQRSVAGIADPPGAKLTVAGHEV